MPKPPQQAILRAAKKTLRVTWDEFATLIDVSPRALKTYRMPDTSADHRGLPDHVRAAVAAAVEVERLRRAAERPGSSPAKGLSLAGRAREVAEVKKERALQSAMKRSDALLRHRDGE